MDKETRVIGTPTRLVIERPAGCTKTSLSINALDKRTRDQAWQTWIHVGEEVLLCESVKLTERGTLLVEVKPECFEYTNVNE